MGSPMMCLAMSRFGIDLLERAQHQLHALLRIERQHLQRVAHPGVGEADDGRLVRAVVEEIGAAGEAVGEGLAHDVAAGPGVAGVPERAVDHDEGLRGLHVVGAVHGHPGLLREEAFLGLDVGGEQPGLAGGDDGVVAARIAPAVGDEEAAVGVAACNAGDAGPRAPAMERIERGAARPVHHAVRRHASTGGAAAARRRRRPGAGGCPGRCRRRAGSPAWSSGSRCPSRRCRSRPGRRSRGGGSCGVRRPRRSRRSRRRCARPRSGTSAFQISRTRAASRSRMASCMALNWAPCSSASFQACSTSRKISGRSSGFST